MSRVIHLNPNANITVKSKWSKSEDHILSQNEDMICTMSLLFLFFVLFIKLNVDTSFCKIYQQYRVKAHIIFKFSWNV